MKGLDHIVMCVNDLDQAADAYRQLGFTVTPRAKHPFGTHNCIIQLDGFFLELLTVGEPEKIPAEKTGHFGFARFNQHYLKQRQGISMLVMDTSDFRDDNKAARKAGLSTYPPFEFSRKAILPSKEVVEVSFGLNFVTHPRIPDAGFFTCQQFQPEYFWKPEYQRHDNTARQIIEVCMVANKPAKFASFMSAFTHCDITDASDSQVTIDTSRGRIVIASPPVFQQRYQTSAPDLSNGPQLAGLTIGVKAAPPPPINICGIAILFDTLAKENTKK